MSLWDELGSEEYTRVWNEFYERFQFEPSVDEANWPGIREPVDSVTFSIAHVYGGGANRYMLFTNDLGQKVIGAFRRCVEECTSIFALEWQSTCYSFKPHEDLTFKSEDDWPIPTLPNGDYYIFLTKDLGCSVFGHPWEQTMCIFGRELIAAFAAEPPLRRNRLCYSAERLEKVESPCNSLFAPVTRGWKYLPLKTPRSFSPRR